MLPGGLVAPTTHDGPGSSSALDLERMAEQIGEDRLKRIECLADAGVPMDVIARRVGLTYEEVEVVLYGEDSGQD